MSGLANMIAVEVAPDVQKLTKALQDFLANDPKDKIHETTDAFRTLGSIVTGVWEVFKSGAQLIAALLA
jgi:hypothetical protein